MAFRGSIREVKLAETKSTDWLTPDDVAELCHMTHGRVCQLLRSGEMLGRKGRGGLWEIQRKEAEKFVEQPAGGGRRRTG